MIHITMYDDSDGEVVELAVTSGGLEFVALAVEDAANVSHGPTLSNIGVSTFIEGVRRLL